MAGTETAAAGLARYGTLVARPDTRPVVLAGVVGRMPLGMTPLALILLLRGAGFSYAIAGGVVAAYSLATAASAPVLGRLIDRAGPRATLAPCGLGNAALLVLVLLAARAGAPAFALCVPAVGAGALQPPLGAFIRSLWPRLLGSAELIESAYGFEAMLQEVFFVVGPLLVAALAGSLGPEAAIAVTAAAGAGGTLAFLALPSVRGWKPHAASSRSRSAALAQPGVRTLTLVSLAMGASFGASEVTMPAFAEVHATRAAGGIPLAALALGSLIGGLLIATAPATDDTRRRLLGTLVLFAAATAPLLAARSLAAMTALAFVAGLPVAPTFASTYRLVNRLALRGTATESFAWITTAVVAGASLGTVAGGSVIAHAGTQGSLLIATGAAAVALLLAAARRATL